ncbi:MAG: Hsp70 family protein [Bdellovibrionota bacterium]
MAPIIGIDLGTSNSCVAVCDANGPRVVLDSKGYNTTPSCVAINSRGKLIVGHLAKSQVITNPFQTIYAVKRLIGRRQDEEAVKVAKQFVSYEIVEGEKGEALVVMNQKRYTPIEISAIVLKKMKKIAEQDLKCEITDAVITVPAYFNDNQRKATRDAGEIAGLNVLRLINEPTAAALAYGYRETEDKNVVVFDLGGGTFDVTILSISKGVYEVLATGGDSYLGGEDFDNRLVEFMVKEFKKKTNIDISMDKMAHQRLKDAAEVSKRELSSKETAQISLPFIAPNVDPTLHFEFEVSRKQFEHLTHDLIGRCVNICDQVLQESGLKREEISDVLLVGGQTRMPKVRQVAREFFGREPSSRVHPDEAIALGASIQGFILQMGRQQAQAGAAAPPPSAPSVSAPEPAPPPGADGGGDDPFASASLEVSSVPEAAPPPPPVASASPPPPPPSAPPPPPKAAKAPSRIPSGEANIAPWKKILLDVTPLTLGVATFGDMSYTIIPKNTTVPTKKSKVFTTVKDNQDSVRIIVTQGESKVSSDNVFLGEVVLPIPPDTPRGQAQIDVTFALDTDGILHVQAKDKKTGKAQSIQIEAQSTLSADEVKSLSKEYSHLEFQGDSEEVSMAS